MSALEASAQDACSPPGRHDPADGSLRRELTAAVGRGNFVLHYQPRVALDSGRPSALEAQLLWPSRAHGMLSLPGFRPVAAEAGLLGPIGDWAMRSACKTAAAWRSGLAVAVNISAEPAEAGVLAEQVTAALAASGLPPERLELQLDETLALRQDADTLMLLAGLRDLGVGLVLDDFGALHGSLTALRRLPLSAVKLDASLVRGVPHDREDTALVRLLVAMARTLGLSVIAEGVASEAQRQCLAAMGCDAAQGVLFGMPLPRDRLAA